MTRGDSNGEHQHAGRHRAELGPHDQRSRTHASSAASSTACRSRRRASLGWIVERLAGLRALHGAVGHALDIQASGALLRAPGNTQRPNQNGDSEILGGIGSRPALVRHVGVLAAGRQHLRQRDAQRRGRRRPRATSTSTRRWSSASTSGPDVRRVPRRRVQRHQLAARATTRTRDARQRHVRPDHELLRRAARPLRPAIYLLSLRHAHGPRASRVGGGARASTQGMRKLSG